MISATKTYLVEQIYQDHRICIGAFNDEATAQILAQRANRSLTAPHPAGPDRYAPHLALATAVRDAGGFLNTVTGSILGTFAVRKVSHICLPGQEQARSK